MIFNIEELKEILKKLNNPPSILIFCPSSIIDNLKEQWDEKIAKAQFYPVNEYIDNEKIWIIPENEIKKSKFPILTF